MLESIAEFLDVVANHKKIYLYGAGGVGQAAAVYLNRCNGISKIEGIIDKNVKSKVPIFSLPLITFDKIGVVSGTPVIVTTRPNIHGEIKKDLCDRGLREIYFCSEKLCEELLQKRRGSAVNAIECMKRITPQPRLSYFVLNILEHCNLNCAGCDHFAPLADERCVSVANIERDVVRFSEIMGGKVDVIGIMGGEPLLHPDLLQIVKIVRREFSATRIQIDTNGILLLDQDEEFWSVCRENDIVIVNTKYPIKQDYAAIEEKCVEENVAFEYYGKTGEVLKTLYKLPFDLTGAQDPRRSFLNCFHANTCITLVEGKLFPCTISANVHIFNHVFDKELEISKEDYLDIYDKNITEKDVLAFVSRPIPFCRYCDTPRRNLGRTWSVSKKKVDEWLLTEREKNPKEELRIRTPRDEIKFEVHLVDHCNLNCRGCFHFSSIAEEEFLDVHEYERDCERLSKLYDGKASQILLLGGEPLLHPQIEVFIRITRRNFKDCKLTIVTNGILLPQMPNSFWECCHECGVSLEPTKYPLKIDYAQIQSIADSHQVKLTYFNNGNIEKTLTFQPLDIKGAQDKEENFYGCYRANLCITLKHGRLYTCIMPAHVIHFAKRFGDDLPLFESDGIDIYKAQSAQEISDFLTKPINMCRYCDRMHVVDGLKWGISEKKRSEWA